MRNLAALILLPFAAGCGQSAGDAPYSAVDDANAPSVAELERQGYVNVDYYPVGCEVPGEPETACDGTGAVFMDTRQFPEDHYAETDEEWAQYQFVCPAIEGQGIPAWKCRAQAGVDGATS